MVGEGANGGDCACVGAGSRWEFSAGVFKKKDLLGVEMVPSLPGQLSAFAMQITCEEHQKVSGEKKTRRAGRAAKFC